MSQQQYLMLKRLINLGVKFFCLLLVSSCVGSSEPTIVQPIHMLGQTRASIQAQSIVELREIILVGGIQLGSETQSLNTDNYWVAWKDPDLGYIVASKSGVPVTLPNGLLNSGSSGAVRSAVSFADGKQI